MKQGSRGAKWVDQFDRYVEERDRYIDKDARNPRRFFLYQIAMTFCLGGLALGVGFAMVSCEKLVREIRAIPTREAPCPQECGHWARRYIDGIGYFWQCSVCSPGTAFDDVDGRPSTVLRSAKPQMEVR